MSYDRLTWPQKSMVDFIMSGEYLSRSCNRNASAALRISKSAVKKRLSHIFDAYEIDREKYLPVVRLVYLRSKELGLIG